jgi:hypothetical protein
VLSPDPAPYSSSQPPMPGLPRSNTSPFQRPSIIERPGASPQAVAERTQPEKSVEAMVEFPKAQHNRSESAASVGAAVMSSSQPAEFAAGQSHQLHRSASVGYFAHSLCAGTAYQAGRRSPDSLRYVPAVHGCGHQALLMCTDTSSSLLLRGRRLLYLCSRRLFHPGSGCQCRSRARQSLSPGHHRLVPVLRPRLLALLIRLIPPAFTAAVVQQPASPCPLSRP